jgi:hypothetical protein
MKPTRLAAILLVSAISALYGCGGGSSDSAPASDAASSVPTPTTAVGPGEPLTSFVSNGEGGVNTVNFGVDASGGFSVLNGTYKVQSGGASGCTIASDPADPSVAACNVIAEGKGFLLCRNTLSPYYTVMMLPQSETQAVTYWEVAGRTFTGIACGPTGPRATGFTFEIYVNGGAFERAEYGTSSWGPGSLEPLERMTMCSQGQMCQRLVIYKVGTGAHPQYFLAMLWQLEPSYPPRVVRLYQLQI